MIMINKNRNCQDIDKDSLKNVLECLINVEGFIKDISKVNRGNFDVLKLESEQNLDF